MIAKRADDSILYLNNTGCALGTWHDDIRASLEKDGTLPEEIADLFVLRVGKNSDGSPRFIIDNA